jgi:hypothetical protein
VLAERHEQPVDLDPLGAGEALLERDDRLFGRPRRDRASRSRASMNSPTPRDPRGRYVVLMRDELARLRRELMATMPR